MGICGLKSVHLIGRGFCKMAMEDEGQAKEIPLATAQPVHAHLGSLWYRQSGILL